jgi:polyferredoxin
MGIDIRDGNQLECITCAACIDACDGVMSKLGKPQGLISYTTLRDYNTHAAEATTAGRAMATAHQKSVSISHIVRPRTFSTSPLVRSGWSCWSASSPGTGSTSTSS